MKFFILVFLIFQGIQQVFACSCVGETMRGRPEKYKDVQYNLTPVGTAGWGYIVDSGGSKVFKFLACYNRKDCNDLILSNYEMKRYAKNLESVPRLTRIISGYDSFEEGLISDLKYNVEVRKKIERESTFRKFESIIENVFNTDCNCPEPEKVSLVWDDRYLAVRSDERYPKSFAGEKVSIAKELEGCGCESMFTNNGFSSIKNLEASRSRYNKGFHSMNGFFYEKGGYLYFKKLAGKDFKYYEDKMPRLKRNGINQLPLMSDVLTYEKKKDLFYKELEALEKDSISIKDKYKCNPVAKYILKQHVVINSEKPFNIVNNSIKNLNLCHMIIDAK